MTVPAECGNREQLLATAAELQALADLIGKYPAETQLIMAPWKKGSPSVHCGSRAMTFQRVTFDGRGLIYGFRFR